MLKLSHKDRASQVRKHFTVYFSYKKTLSSTFLFFKLISANNCLKSDNKKGENTEFLKSIYIDDEHDYKSIGKIVVRLKNAKYF